MIPEPLEERAWCISSTEGWAFCRPLPIPWPGVGLLTNNHLLQIDGYLRSTKSCIDIWITIRRWCNTMSISQDSSSRYILLIPQGSMDPCLMIIVQCLGFICGLGLNSNQKLVGYIHNVHQWACLARLAITIACKFHQLRKTVGLFLLPYHT